MVHSTAPCVEVIQLQETIHGEKQPVYHILIRADLPRPLCICVYIFNFAYTLHFFVNFPHWAWRNTTRPLHSDVLTLAPTRNPDTHIIGSELPALVFQVAL